MLRVQNTKDDHDKCLMAYTFSWAASVLLNTDYQRICFSMLKPVTVIFLETKDLSGIQYGWFKLYQLMTVKMCVRWFITLTWCTLPYLGIHFPVMYCMYHSSIHNILTCKLLVRLTLLQMTFFCTTPVPDGFTALACRLKHFSTFIFSK